MDELNGKLDALTRTVEAQAESHEQLKAQLDALKTQLDTAQTQPQVTAAESEDAPAPFEGVTCSRREGGTRTCTITKARFDELNANPTLLAKQARVVPSVRDGTPQGFKLYGIRRGSLPKALTIRNGDMLVAVNGKPFTSVDDALKLVTELAGVQRLTMEFRSRNGDYTVSVSVVDE